MVSDMGIFMPEDIIKLLMGVAGIRQQDGFSPKSNNARRENSWGESHPQAGYAVLLAKPLYSVIVCSGQISRRPKPNGVFGEP